VDLNTNAFRIVNDLTTENKGDSSRTEKARKAGLVGGRARAKSMDPKRRKEIAIIANRARWDKATHGVG